MKRPFYLPVWLIRNFLGSIPIKLRNKLGLILGSVFYTFNSKDRAIAEKQLELFLGKDAVMHTRGVFQSLGISALEGMNLKPLTLELDKHISCKNKEALEELKNHTGPSIALSAHTGNWDLLAAYMIDAGFPVSVLGKKAEITFLQELLLQIRTAYGASTLWKTREGTPKQLISMFRKNRMVSVLIDQDTKVGSVPVPFFGENAKSPSSLVQIAKRFDAKVFTIFNVRTAPLKYEVFVEMIDNTLSTNEILLEYSLRLEKIVRAYPEQWVWFHKRWRTPEEGKTLSHKEYVEFLNRSISKEAQGAVTA